MKARKHHRLIRRLAVGLAAAAVAVPSASAAIPDGASGHQAPAWVTELGGPTRWVDGAPIYEAGVVTRPDDRPGSRGPGSAPGADGVVRPDDRPGSRGPGSTPVTDGVGRPLDPAAVRGDGTQVPSASQEPRTAPPVARTDGVGNPGAVPPEAPAQVPVASGGFDWRDAGVGMAIGAAAVLALAAGMLVIGRRRDTLARV